MTQSKNPILIGCSGWSYADWEGPFYPEGMDSADYLGWYADRFPIVEVDSTFYRIPSKGMVEGWRRKTPANFKFALKVPQVITHQKQLRGCESDVDAFVASILPLGEKLSSALLQLGYFNRGAFASLDDFLGVLDPFLAHWPHDKVALAVEVRNPRWVGPQLAEVLRDHKAAFTLTEQGWMPRPSKVLELIDPVTGPLSFVRLLGDREAIEKVTTRWEKVVVDRSTELGETAGVIRSMAERVPVTVFVNNHYAGHSPSTAKELRDFSGSPSPSRPSGLVRRYSIDPEGLVDGIVASGLLAEEAPADPDRRRAGRVPGPQAALGPGRGHGPDRIHWPVHAGDLHGVRAS